MNYVLTFVASASPLTDKHLKRAREIAVFYNLPPVGTPVWLAAKKAADLTLPGNPGGALLAHLREEFAADKIDIFTLPAENRRKKLLLADMESTIVDSEALDELAAFAGIEEKIKTITKNAMEGRIDFKDALRERVSLLKGLPAQTLSDVLKKMMVNPGAHTLVKTMTKHGAKCVLVSGGFTFFTEPVAAQTGFDYQHGNVLEIDNGKLSGTVADPVLDKFAKLDFLKKYCADLEISEENVMAIGDGANDIPMLKTAGLGVGYRPKDAVAKAVDNLIIHGDLSAPLYAQGYRAEDLS